MGQTDGVVSYGGVVSTIHINAFEWLWDLYFEWYNSALNMHYGQIAGAEHAGAL